MGREKTPHSGWVWSPVGCPYCTYWFVVSMGLMAISIVVIVLCRWVDGP